MSVLPQTVISAEECPTAQCSLAFDTTHVHPSETEGPMSRSLLNVGGILALIWLLRCVIAAFTGPLQPVALVKAGLPVV
ncbi:hypothetical protein EGR_10375 [Echinococcus granulosus]|uniref:Uncharacterized protein n=1 Tax=Echinococcus granulosus TaxID=6210 RepID=W6U2J6_ECHGR|nr:hypothetical protein EGR_10375 [Echinococcus granulosus]EUB54776.1 hypothetical protein EGR_10375 [Echinococcus granulosus]